MKDVEEDEQVVVPKPVAKKSTSTTKLRQTSRSKMNSVQELDSSPSVSVAEPFLAPTAAAAVTASKPTTTTTTTTTTNGTSVKPSTSKSKLTKHKKQSILESDEPTVVQAACEANKQSYIVLGDDSMPVESAAVVKPSSKSSKVAPSSSRASANADPDPRAPAVSKRQKSTMNLSPIFNYEPRRSKRLSCLSSASKLSDCTNLSTVSGARNTTIKAMSTKWLDKKITENMDPKDDGKLCKALNHTKKAV